MGDQETSKTEVWFYHLERAPLERVLPDLLEKTLSRGWRALVRVGDEARLEPINDLLWTYKPDSFLAHGSEKDGYAEEQPIYLTSEEDNPNDANALFLVEGATAGDISSFARCITIFNGHDEQAVEASRAFWKEASGKGYDVTYWQQSPQGKWEKKG